MGYADYLWQLLAPMGVYRRDGYSGGELEALGAALDQADAYIREKLRELLPDQAEGEGLEMAESLFPMIPGEEIAQRQDALRTLYQTDNQRTTKEELKKTLAACGVTVTMEEHITTKLLYVFVKETLTLDSDPVFVSKLLKTVLPCHTDTKILFSYYEKTEGKEKTEEMTVEEMAEMTRSQWEELMAM